MDMTPQAWPDWYDGRHINEVLFCQQFLDKHPMKCVRGRLFTVDGLIEDEGQIGNLILEEISGVLTSGLSKVVTNLLASIKLQAYSPPLPIETDRIHVANGTYFMDGSFTADKSYCNNRLTVSYNPNAPAPNRWLQFLSDEKLVSYTFFFRPGFSGRFRHFSKSRILLDYRLCEKTDGTLRWAINPSFWQKRKRFRLSFLFFLCYIVIGSRKLPNFLHFAKSNGIKERVRRSL